MLAVASAFEATVLSLLAVVVIVASAIAEALAAVDAPDVDDTVPIALLGEVLGDCDVATTVVACCTLLTNARSCAEPATLGSLPLVESEVLEFDLPLPLVPVLEPVPDVEPLDGDADDVEEDDDLEFDESDVFD